MLKSLRLESGMTRAELSRAVKINQGTLANYENEIRQADYKTLFVLADYFDVTVDYLLGYEESAQQADKLDRPMTSSEKQLLRNYRSLPESSRETVYELVRNIKELSDRL